MDILEEDLLRDAEEYLNKPKKDYCEFGYYGGLKRHDKVVINVDLSNYIRKDLLALILKFGTVAELTSLDGMRDCLLLIAKLTLIKRVDLVPEYLHLPTKTFDNVFDLAMKLAKDNNLEGYQDENSVRTFDELHNCCIALCESFEVEYIEDKVESEDNYVTI